MKTLTMFNTFAENKQWVRDLLYYEFIELFE